MRFPTYSDPQDELFGLKYNFMFHTEKRSIW